MRSSSCRVGAVDETTAKITFVSKSTVAPTVSCSGGVVVVGTPDDRYNTGGNSIATVLITITGLSGYTDYTYTINQAGDVINGSFKTMPDKSTPFSYIVISCDHPSNNYGQNPWKLIRSLMSADIPLAAVFHIDDVSYVDKVQVNDADTTILSTGEAQTTGLGTDYAIGWAHYYGLIEGGTGTGSFGIGKTDSPDRNYVFQNLPSFLSGGDHAVEDNHCRGALVNGVPNTDYHGCDRTGGGLEEVAKAEWEAFIGDANATPLRADKWHWGCEIGCMKFALYDYSLYSDPYDSVLNPDPVGYSAEQIGDINTYLSDSTFDYKCHLMESPPTTYGNPWKNWHPTEADGWKTTFDADDNLNGVDGNSFAVCGDCHALFAVKHDTFWYFCTGAFNGTSLVNSAQETPGSIANLNSHWSGQNQFSEHGFSFTGDRMLGGFWHFTVYPKDRVEAVCYSATGSKFSPVFTMDYKSTDNQWTKTRAKFW